LAAGSGNTLTQLEVTTETSLLLLQELVASIVKVPLHRQKLVLGEKVLSDMAKTTSMSEAGVVNGSQLALVTLPLPPPPPPKLDALFRINPCPKHPYTRCACPLAFAGSITLQEPETSTFALPQLAQVQPNEEQQLFRSLVSVPFGRSASTLSLSAMETLRDAWLSQARGEQASALGFLNHHKELKRLGAPERLLKQVEIAAEDERRHAEMCATLASRFDPEGKQHTPPHVERDVAICESMEAMMTKLVCEGCWGETLGALVAARQYKSGSDTQIKEMLKTILVEEASHCVLAWNTAAWAVNITGAPLLDCLKATIEKLGASHAKAPVTPTPQPKSFPEIAQYGMIISDDLEDIERNQGPLLVFSLRRRLFERGTNVSTGLDIEQCEQAFDFSTIVSKHVNRVAGVAIL
jgi:hypothetical protein